MMTSPKIEVHTQIQDEVGESPFWDQTTQSLYWVDIIRKQIRNFQPQTGNLVSWDTADFPTAMAACEGNPDLFIVAFAAGVCLFNKKDQNITPLSSPDQLPGNRLNEGKCDPMGRFWVGSMQTNLTPAGEGKEITKHSGAVFSIDTDKKIVRHTEYEFGITNTMLWTADQKTFYVGDSLRNVLFAYDYDNRTGIISNPKVFYKNDQSGFPDGSAIDNEGCVWNARFGGSEIIRITPQGKVDERLKLPVTNPTSCTFGGQDGKTLYVTSARFSLTEAQLKSNPNEGTLLVIELPVGGGYENKCCLDFNRL